MSSKRKRYSASFKAGAVALVKQQGRSVAQAAKEIGISESSFRRWLTADSVEAGEKDGLTAADKAEIRELKKELQILRMERDILKNSRARGRFLLARNSWSRSVTVPKRSGRPLFGASSPAKNMVRGWLRTCDW